MAIDDSTEWWVIVFIIKMNNDYQVDEKFESSVLEWSETCAQVYPPFINWLFNWFVWKYNNFTKMFLHNHNVNLDIHIFKWQKLYTSSTLNKNQEIYA